MGFISKAKQKIYASAEKKAKELYSKASPTLKKDIDKFLSSKAKDVLKYIPYAVGVGILVYAISQDSSDKEKHYAADDWKSLSVSFYDSHNTYNYYKEK